MIGIIIIVLIIFLIPNIMDFYKKEQEKEEQAAEAKRKREKIENDYKALVKKYADSDLTRKILMHICNGDFSKNAPEEIFVGRDFVRSTLNSLSYTYDFKQNRVSPLHIDQGCDWSVKPTKAMAEAINELMGRKYEICQEDNTAHMKLKPKIDF